MREEVNNDFRVVFSRLIHKSDFDCNSLIVVGTVVNARSRVPVDSVNGRIDMKSVMNKMSNENQLTKEIRYDILM